jgi:hypothetical protein
VNTCPDLLAALKLRMRDLELDAVEVKARISELGEMITMLEHPQRKRGRPPGPRAVFTPRRVTPSDPPLHVPGAIHTPLTVTTQPDDDELPFQSDAPGA